MLVEFLLLSEALLRETAYVLLLLGDVCHELLDQCIGLLQLLIFLADDFIVLSDLFWNSASKVLVLHVF